MSDKYLEIKLFVTVRTPAILPHNVKNANALNVGMNENTNKLMDAVVDVAQENAWTITSVDMEANHVQDDGQA